MKANFALSLSFEGLRLLHRAAGGWRFVGEVSLDEPDLNGALAALRRTALELDPSGLRTKLILPDEQIKYTSIDTGDTPPDALRSAAEAALDGATPYDVSELAFDLSPDGARTHIAAVAEETLAEAEAFAMEHRFEPISFVAVPQADTFLGEPFFGATKHALTLLAHGDDVEPDGVAVVELGALDTGDMPIAAVEDLPPARVPQDLSGFEVTADPEPASGAEVQIPPLGAARRDDLPPAPVSGVLAGSLPGSEPVAPPQTPPVPGSFVSRRGSSARQQPIPPAPRSADFDRDDRDLTPPAYVSATAPTSPAGDESQRMTVFGARDPAAADGTAAQSRPRYLGLVLTALLLVFLAGVAAWSSAFLGDDSERASGFFAPRAPDPAPSTQSQVDALPTVPDAVTAPDAEVLTASLSDTLPDGLEAPDALARPAPVSEFDADAAQSHYAVTGIWTIPPAVPAAPGLMSLDNLYLTSIDRKNLSFDAVALQPARGYLQDEAIAAPNNPAPPGVSFALDSRGLVVPTPEGAMSPDGIMVFLGKPPVVPPATPDRSAAVIAEAVAQARPELAAFRPRSRPDNLVENTERQQLGGLSRSELAAYRPQMRPATTKLEEEEDETPTAQAVATSYRPEARPRNFARTVARAQQRAQEDPAPRQVAAVAPRVVQPSIPSRSSLTKEATVRNAIRLNRINLMGVYGTPSNRRALVRLSNGRYKKVKVGDRIDGGRVSAIGEGELRYRKGNRSIVLKMPKT